MSSLGTAALAAFFIVLIILASAGNFLVTIALISDRRLRKRKENLFLLSLAISDLLVSLLVMIFAAINDLLGRWPFGDIYCSVWISLDIMCCTASILNMCAIAFDRYFHISNPLKYDQFVSRTRITWIILALWAVSAIIGCLQLLFEKNDEKDLTMNHTATFNSSNLNNDTENKHCELRLKLPFAIASSMLSFFVPATVMILVYWKLYRCARRHLRSIRTQIRAVTEALLAHTRRLYYPRDQKQNSSAENDLSDHKARITLGVIMGVFLICWLPFFCVNILRSFDQDLVPINIFVALTWCGYFNSTANPIIYSIFNRDFRNAFLVILKKMFIWRSKEVHMDEELRTFHSFNNQSGPFQSSPNNNRHREFHSADFDCQVHPSYGTTENSVTEKDLLQVPKPTVKRSIKLEEASATLNEPKRSVSVYVMPSNQNSRDKITDL